MTSNAGKTPLIRWDLCALAVFFVPACFIFVWKALRTHLIYAAFGDLMEFPTFVPDRAFFLERVSAAGGPAKYISDLLSQYLYYDLAGAFIITLLAIAFYLATLVLIRTAANLRSHVLAAVPAVAVVAFHADYNHRVSVLLALFAFPQNGAALTMMTAQGLPFGATFTRVSDLFFEMGNINGAEQWAYEVLESEGPSPLVLNRLVDINLAKNQSAVAAVFLRALSKDIVHGRAAKERLRTIESDLAIADPRIQHARDMYWKTDKVLKYNTPEKFLLDLLEQHPDNRMAFEYLMAFYLLIHDQQKIIDNLHRLDTLGYDRIPRHLEEAIMVHADKTRSPVDLKGRPISRQTVERHRRYLERFKQAGGSKDVAMRVLAPEFGGSYFFYSMFGFSGVGQ